MKFDIIREVATVNGVPVGEGSFVYDTVGSYIIKSIDWSRKLVLVDEVEISDDGNAVSIDTYTRTFIDMKDCEC